MESSRKEDQLASVKVQKILVYSSTAFEDVMKGAVLRAREKRARDKGIKWATRSL